METPKETKYELFTELKTKILEALQEAAVRKHTINNTIPHVYAGLDILRQHGYEICNMDLYSAPDLLPVIYANLKHVFAEDITRISSDMLVDWRTAVKFTPQLPVGYESDNTLFDLFDESEDYPRNIMERGVPPNYCYDYVSSTFLNGLVNYLDKIFYAAVLEPADESYQEELEQFDPTLSEQFTLIAKGMAETHHTKIQSHFDVIIMGQTENSYWLLWYPGNSANSLIGRLDKDRVGAPDDMVKLFFRHINTNSDFTGRAAVFEPKGWVKF